MVKAHVHIITYPQKRKDSEFSLYYYENTNETIKSRINFKQNVFSFLIEGYKEIYSQTPQMLSCDEFALISSPNCLMTEKRVSKEKIYKSILLFFSNKALNEFQLKYHDIIERANDIDKSTFDVITLPYDAYSRGFRDSLILLKENGNLVYPNLLKVKFDEIMLYLLQRYPARLLCLLKDKNIVSEIRFKSTIENNICHQITMDEFAFLCNMSLSTFKRHFNYYYKTSPKKYILSQRMQMAELLLKNGERPANIYRKLGYKTSSNFLKAFKAYFGYKTTQIK